MSLYDLTTMQNLNMSEENKQLYYRIRMNAQEEEDMASSLHYSFRLLLGLSSYELPDEVLQQLQADGYHFVIGRHYSYLEWTRKNLPENG